MRFVRIRTPSRKPPDVVGHNFASRTGDQDRNWDGEVNASYNLGFLAHVASLRSRAGYLHDSDPHHAARAPKRAATGIARVSHHRSHVASESYSPQFSSIIVDGNSGAVLTSNNPDGSRHPASLTKIMTLYLLFESLESKKMNLDTEMQVSEHASEQAPTKLGLRPGETIKVEDAIKGLVTRSANDAAVVIAEAIGGDEDDFAKLMTRKARALGMTKTTYRNASGLPNDEQVTTARDQATLGRAIQDRFPTYYRYFSTSVFNYRGQSIRNHNRLLGNVEGVDGIKTGYTRASGFNLVTSMRRGNRHLVGVVLGGRSGGSRDAIMRNLLAENLEKGATTRTVAAITERNPADANADVAEAEAASRPTEMVQVNGAIAASEPGMDAQRPVAPAKPSLMAAAAAALPPPPAKVVPQAKPEPAQFTSGVIQTQQIAAIPGSAEPMKPVKVKTVQVKAGKMKLASAGPSQPTADHQRRSRPAPKSPRPPAPWWRGPPRPTRPKPPAWKCRRSPPISAPAKACSASCPPPASPLPRRRPTRRRRSPMPIRRRGGAGQRRDQAGRPRHRPLRLDHPGRRAGKRRRSQAAHRPRPQQGLNLLSKADPFTEAVVAKDNRKLFRARFAGLERDQAEAACKTLKRADISCITVRN